MEDGQSREAGDRDRSCDEVIPGIVNQIAERSVSDPMPQDGQLVMILPIEKFDMERETSLGVAQGTVGVESSCLLRARERTQDVSADTVR